MGITGLTAMHLLPLALTINPGTIIFLVVAIVFVFRVLNAVFQGYAKLKQTLGGVDLQQLKNKMDQMQKPADDSESDGEKLKKTFSAELRNLPQDPAQRIEKIKQLREQMKETLATSSPQKLQPAGPNNLTMKDVEARARAKAVYEARAAELRKLRGQVQTQSTTVIPPMQTPPTYTAAPVPQRMPTAPPPMPVAKAQPRPAPARVTTSSTNAYDTPETSETPVTLEPVARQQAPTAQTQNRPRVAKSKSALIANTSVTSLDTAATTRRAFSLREAMLWREILDKPLALRED